MEKNRKAKWLVDAWPLLQRYKRGAIHLSRKKWRDISGVALLVFFLASGAVFAGEIGVNGLQLTTPGWRLLGWNKSSPLAMSTVSDAGDYILSVWKWSGNTWQVYLPGQDSASYAMDKGLTVLSSVAVGEGFWLNVQSVGTVPINSAAVNTGAAVSIEFPAAGWYLLGWAKPDPLTTATVDQASLIESVWKWSGTIWQVFLPGKDSESYASSKGFEVLASVAGGEGFWVRAKTNGSMMLPLKGVGAWTITIQSENITYNPYDYCYETDIGKKIFVNVPAETASSFSYTMAIDGNTINGAGTISEGVYAINNIVYPYVNGDGEGTITANATFSLTGSNSLSGTINFNLSASGYGTVCSGVESMTGVK